MQSQHHHITGNFDVKLTPQAAAPAIESAKLGRQTLDKTFYGDLNATSLGEMLAAMTEVKGSAGYVAIERVTGTLLGKKGSFALMPGLPAFPFLALAGTMAFVARSATVPAMMIALSSSFTRLWLAAPIVIDVSA